MERREDLKNYISNYKQLKTARKTVKEIVYEYLKLLGQRYEISMKDHGEDKIIFSILGFQAKILFTILPIKETCYMTWYCELYDPIEMKDKTVLVHRTDFNSPSVLEGRIKDDVLEKLISFCEAADKETMKILGCEN